MENTGKIRAARNRTLRLTENERTEYKKKLLYAEDLDLFYTINSSGIKIKDANAPICHYGGGSTSAIWSSLERETIVQRSMRHFYRRHSNMLQYVAVKLYYLLHYIFKNPARVPTDISAWIKSYGKI